MFKLYFARGGCTFPSNALRVKTKVTARIYLQVAAGLVYEAENTYGNMLLIENFVLSLQQNKNNTAFKLHINMERCNTPYVMLDAYDVNL